MKVKKNFLFGITLAVTIAFVGCEAEEDTYVSPSGQEVAPDVVANTPADAVTVNLLIDDELYSCALNDAFNWQVRGGYRESTYTYEGIVYHIASQQWICDLDAMNGLGNITTFSTPNSASECAVIKGHGYIFYSELIPESICIRNPYYQEVPTDVQQAVLNDYCKNNALDYYCVWVKDAFEDGITVQYVVRKTSVVTNSLINGKR